MDPLYEKGLQDQSSQGTAGSNRLIMLLC